MSRVVPNPCDGCICAYCRWQGTDNCLMCENGSCLKCGERRKSKHPLYECEGYAMKPTRIRKEPQP